MRTEKNEFLLRCACAEPHFVQLLFFADDWKESFGEQSTALDLFVTLTMADCGFRQRAKNALLYVFKRGEIGHWGEICLNLSDKADAEQLEGLIKFLADLVEKSKKLRKKGET